MNRYLGTQHTSAWGGGQGQYLGEFTFEEEGQAWGASGSLPDLTSHREGGRWLGGLLAMQSLFVVHPSTPVSCPGADR